VVPICFPRALQTLLVVEVMKRYDVDITLALGLILSELRCGLQSPPNEYY